MELGNVMLSLLLSGLVLVIVVILFLLGIRIELVSGCIWSFLCSEVRLGAVMKYVNGGGGQHEFYSSNMRSESSRINRYKSPKTTTDKGESQRTQDDRFLRENLLGAEAAVSPASVKSAPRPITL